MAAPTVEDAAVEDAAAIRGWTVEETADGVGRWIKAGVNTNWNQADENSRENFLRLDNTKAILMQEGLDGK
eukprot:COSAG01_NODE_31849_length_590_cov_1.311609_1_plen_70_part_10